MVGTPLEQATVTCYKHDYIGNIEYQNNTLEAYYTEEGRINYAQGSRTEYNIKDHLGNTRVCFTPPATGNAPKILQQTNYYAFGLPIGNLSRTYPLVTGGALALEDKYQYNQKELNNDFGLLWNDYGARWYNPQLAIWHQIDPLAEVATSWSSYSYVYNNPISHIDPTGMAGELASTFVNQSGTVLEHRDDGDPFVYMVSNPEKWNGSKDGLGVLGFEDPDKDYKKGDQYSHYAPDPNKSIKEFSSLAIGGLLLDDATGIGGADDILIPLIVGGVAIYLAVKVIDALPITIPGTTTAPYNQHKYYVVFIDGDRFPESAQHAYDAIKQGFINIGNYDKSGAPARRRKNTAPYPAIKGKDRDEFLPAILRPLFNLPVSVRHIDFSDNRRAGQSIGHQLSNVSDGAFVIVIPINVPKP